ncbi:hypothetical protein ACHAXN_006565 [Cyclotella atomus]
MASRSGRQGNISPELKQLIEGGRAATQKPEASSAAVAPNSDEGCRICCRDEDHANLLLCEACNDEYHTYCLQPPLKNVPEDDWFCDNCKQLHSVKDDDGLDSLVSALPPEYTSRFGEIVWAAGGNGFGWWPACIYDPRLTVGGARQLARKNLGKRHLIYFFECNDAPFTCLGDSRLTKWEAGFIEEYDLGKTAKSGNKNKAVLFEKALSLAQMENERPIELRMDWNHQTEPQLKIPKSKAPTSSPTSQQSAENHPKKKQKIHAADGTSTTMTTSSVTGTDNTTSVNRKSINVAQGSLIESSEDGPLLCKILRRLPAGASNPPGSAGLEFSINVGFVTLPSRQKATFADIRRAAENDLDDDCFPSTEGEIDESGDKCPVSIKQEKTLGPVLEFLKSTSHDGLLGNGTASSPLKIVFMDV